MTRCLFDPSDLVGVPLGQFHCPECPGGCMVLAGLEHGPCEQHCAYADDEDRALWALAETWGGAVDDRRAE